MGCVFALASIPAFRPAWERAITVRPVTGGDLESAPLEGFTTPYVSFATVRFTGAELPSEAIDLSLVRGNERLLTARLTSVDRREYRTAFTPPRQFPPSDAIRVLLSGGAATADVTIGYDGREPAVKAIRYWWPWVGTAAAAGFMLLVAPITWHRQHRTVSMLQSTVRQHAAVSWVLGAAVMIRAVLILRGGQYFDYDEFRYAAGAQIFELLSTGNIDAAVDALIKAPDHPGFRVVALVLAFFHVASAWFAGWPVSEMRHPSGEWLPTLLLSLGSVCAIGLTYALAHRLQASKRESLLAALLMLSSSSMLMYSRHLVPYDIALALLLFALWIGLRRDAGSMAAYAAGAIAGFAFLTYTGYWLLAAAVGAMQVAGGRRSVGRVLTRAGMFALGLLSLPALLAAAGAARGVDVVGNMRRFSESVINGDFSEGWSLPWEALWHAEGLLVAVLAAGVWLALHYQKRGLAWFAPAAGVYAGLVVGSSVMHRFVVYDRISRQMLPLICLTAAHGLARAGTGGWLRGSRAAILYAGVAILGLVNAAPHVIQEFPREMVHGVVRDHGAAGLTIGSTLVDFEAVTGSLFLPIDPTRAAYNPERPSDYVLFNVTDLWVDERIERVQPPPVGRVLIHKPHPRQRRSMQYHGYTRRQRAFLRSIDVSMRLIDTRPAARTSP